MRAQYRLQRVSGGRARTHTRRTHVWIPAGLADAQDVVEKETGAVLQVDAPALEEGAHGGVFPEGMYVGGEGFEEGRGVRRVAPGGAAEGFRGHGGGRRTDGLGEGVAARVLGRVAGERARDVLEDGLPCAARANTEFAIAKEDAVFGVVTGTRGPLGPAGRGGQGRGGTTELGEELAGELCLDAEEREEAETEGRVGLGQRWVGVERGLSVAGKGRAVAGGCGDRRGRRRTEAGAGRGGGEGRLELVFDDGQELLDGAGDESGKKTRAQTGHTQSDSAG